MPCGYRSDIPIGTRFGRLVIVDPDVPPRRSAPTLKRPRGNVRRLVLCRCDCGREYVQLLNNLVSGRAKSCRLCGKRPSTIYPTLKERAVQLQCDLEELQKEIAWAGGLFEGEGSFHLGKDNHKGVVYFKPVAQLVSTDEDTVERFQKAIGLGSITGPYSRTADGHKPYWKWTIANRSDFPVFAELVKPWLCRRRSLCLAGILDQFEKGLTIRQGVA